MIRAARRTSATALLALLLPCTRTALPQQQPPTLDTIRTTTRIVYVDVVVRDSSGHVVHGLSQESFSLTENGKPQRIDLFEPHTGGPAPSATSPSPAPARQFQNVPADASDLSLNMVLFDLLDTSPADQGYARERMIAFLRALPPGKQVALFVLTDQLHMVQGFTSDSNTLIRAAQSINLKELNRTRSATRQMRDLDNEAYQDSQATIASVGGALESALRQEDFQNLKGRLDATGDAFLELARAVNGYPGRKNLFWLAGSFPSSTTNSLQAISTGQLTSIGAPGVGTSDNPFTGSPTRFGLGSRQALTNGGVGANTAPLSERADRAVADSQIAVYPISVTGVETDAVGADQSGIGTGGTSLVDTRSQMFHDREDSREVMNNIARATGGEAFYGNNDVSGLLTRGFEDSENYYTLAFQPTDHTWDGHYRKLAVSLAARGYALSYRRGYFGMPEQPAKDIAHQFQGSMRIDTPTSTMLSLRASPTLAPGPAPATGSAPAQPRSVQPRSGQPRSVQVDASIDVRGIGFNTDAGGKRHARLEIGLMAYPLDIDPASAVPTAAAASTAAQPRKPIQTSATVNLNLTPEQYTSLLGNGLFLHPQIPLQAGRYVLRLGVLDTATGRIGTLNLPVRMP